MRKTNLFVAASVRVPSLQGRWAARSVASQTGSVDGRITSKERVIKWKNSIRDNRHNACPIRMPPLLGHSFVSRVKQIPQSIQPHPRINGAALTGSDPWYRYVRSSPQVLPSSDSARSQTTQSSASPACPYSGRCSTSPLPQHRLQSPHARGGGTCYSPALPSH